MKTLILDSSALISLSESCMASVVRFLKAKRKLAFVAPQAVYSESVDRPSKIKKYGFSAVRIKKLFSDGNVEKVIPKQDRVSLLLEIANNVCLVDGKPLELIQIGEAECLAYLLEKDEGVLVMDEKTLRLLLENPEKLRTVLKQEYRGKVQLNKEKLAKWQQMTRGVKVLRSTEIVASAIKLGYFDHFKESKEEAAHAAIYALRGFGCSITNEELVEFDNMVLGR